MPMLCGTAATLAVTSIYYTWRAYHYVLTQRHRSLRERVAYMLWVMAQQAD